MELIVLEERKDDFDVECKRLKNKAKKLGFAFNCVYKGYDYEIVKDGVHEYHYKYYIYDIDLPEYAVEGWELVATLIPTEKHSSRFTAVIISDTPVPTEYWTANTHKCDHCGRSVAHRSKLYLIHNKTTDEWKQIGTTCIKDYLGDAFFDYAKWATYVKVLKEYSKRDIGASKPYYRKDHLIALVLCVIRRKHGFVSSTHTDSTYENLHSTRNIITEADKAKAKIICEWYENKVKNLTDADIRRCTDYERNLYALTEKEYYSTEHELKMMCSAVAYYEKQQCNSNGSNHIGDVGDKITIQAMVRSTNLYSTTYGDTWLVECIDKHANIIKFFISSVSRNGKVVEKLEKLDLINITGTIKKHDEFRGTKSTLLTRITFNK